MAQRTIEITTEDGRCPAHVFTPGGAGPWPGVLMYMDGIGIRPALFAMGERLASAGYHVLLPDLFYRAGAYEAPDPAKLFSDPETRTTWSKRFFSTATIDNIMRDTKAFLAHLAASPDVVQPRYGVTGYCMGGRFALAAAGYFPDQIAAAASYHGGNIGADAPDSPHHLAPKMRAQIYVAPASNDPEDQTQRLAQALAAAGVDHVIETYPAKHGWVPTDTPVHDPAAAERHWQTLTDLFARALPRSRQ